MPRRRCAPRCRPRSTSSSSPISTAASRTRPAAWARPVGRWSRSSAARGSAIPRAQAVSIEIADAYIGLNDGDAETRVPVVGHRRAATSTIPTAPWPLAGDRLLGRGDHGRARGGRRERGQQRRRQRRAEGHCGAHRAPGRHARSAAARGSTRCWLPAAGGPGGGRRPAVPRAPSILRLARVSGAGTRANLKIGGVVGTCGRPGDEAARPVCGSGGFWQNGAVVDGPEPWFPSRPYLRPVRSLANHRSLVPFAPPSPPRSYACPLSSPMGPPTTRSPTCPSPSSAATRSASPSTRCPA